MPGILLKRRELYRVFASNLTKKYGRIFLEEFDLRAVTEIPDAEHEKEALYQRSKAAISNLRIAIERACAREGVLCRTIAAQWSSRVCVCGAKLEFDAVANLMVRCGKCNNCLLYTSDAADE